MQNKTRDKTELSMIVQPLLDWYDIHARILPWRENPLPYRVWVSEIMLQQTRVEAVIPYFDRWFETLPTLSQFAHAPEDQILKLWEGLGYYNRVRNMQKAAQIVMDNYEGQIPNSYEALLSLPGIGEYTAGAVSSIAFQLPVPCVDGNVLRVLTRILADSSQVDKASVKKYFTDQIKGIIPKNRPGDFNQALMELGATVCLPNGLPKCEGCPVQMLCRAYQTGSVMEYPVKAAKKARKVEKKTVFLFIRNDKTAIRKRDNMGLLSGLWEFPNVTGHLSSKKTKELLTQWGVSAESIQQLEPAKHIFTHIEWHMAGYLVLVKDSDTIVEDFKWVSINQLKEQFTIPSAYKAFYQHLLSVQD